MNTYTRRRLAQSPLCYLVLVSLITLAISMVVLDLADPSLAYRLLFAGTLPLDAYLALLLWRHWR